MAKTIHCLNAVEQMQESDEGRRNMDNLDHKCRLDNDNLASRDVVQWSSSLMQEFKAHFTAKTKIMPLLDKVKARQVLQRGWNKRMVNDGWMENPFVDQRKRRRKRR